MLPLINLINIYCDTSFISFGTDTDCMNGYPLVHVVFYGLFIFFFYKDISVTSINVFSILEQDNYE
jgi:hypothetical protein